MAISVAMFGLTVGSIIVYLFPASFSEDRLAEQLARSSLAFAVSTVVSFFAHLKIPFVPDMSLTGLLSVAATYSVISIPFVMSGIAVSLALTKFPGHVNSLYATDLAGAAIGG